MDPTSDEKVGILLRSGETVELLNISSEPQDSFLIEFDELLPHLSETVSTWHTHPRGTAMASFEDLNFFRRWPDLTHFIVSPQGVNEYEVEDGEVLCK